MTVHLYSRNKKESAQDARDIRADHEGRCEVQKEHVGINHLLV